MPETLKSPRSSFPECYRNTEPYRTLQPSVLGTLCAYLCSGRSLRPVHSHILSVSSCLLLELHKGFIELCKAGRYTAYSGLFLPTEKS